MENPFIYKSLSTTSTGLYKEKGSKFISYAYPCDSEETIKTILESIKKEHPQARHLCYAYKIGVSTTLIRTNDDGEPNNSAGAPILGQIQSYNLNNVFIGVIRYFGGTKLGVGGLVNAYKTAAKDAIENNNICTKELENELQIQFKYEDMSKVIQIIKKTESKINSQEINTICTINACIKLSKLNTFKTQLESIENAIIKE
jgi:uncharacterized YigZ family protein